MILRAYFFLLLSILPSFCKVQVDVGGQTFLSIKDFPSILPVQCSIIVDQYSDDHLRVGVIVPQVFSCSTPDNFIRYIHDGNPYLTDDEVHFIALQFQNSQVVETKFSLQIKILNLHNSQVPSIFVNSSFTGVPWNAVKLRNRVSNHAKCTAKFDIEPNSQIFYHANHTAVIGSSTTCQDFTRFLLKLPEHDYTSRYVKVQYEIDSGEDLPIIENHFLPIDSTIRKSLLNNPPQIGIGLPKELHMNQYSLLIIYPNVLIVTDDSTPIDSIILKTVGRNVSFQDGFLVHIADQWKPITNFKYGDLLRRKIAFRGPTNKLSHPSNKELCLLAVDFQFSESSAICLSILIKPLLLAEPKVIKKKDLIMLRGSSQIISTHQIGLVNREDAILQVKGGPYSGSISVDDKLSMSFNYSDVGEGKVVYTHNGEMNFADKIILKIFNALGSTRLQLDIKIIDPTDLTTPWIVSNESLNVSDTDTLITSQNIDAIISESDENNDELIFHSITNPQHGVLIKKSHQFTRGEKVTSFTKKQIKKGMIYYRVSSKHHLRRTDSIWFIVRHALIMNSNVSSSQIKLTVNIDPSSLEDNYIIRRCPETQLTTTLSVMKSLKVLTSQDLCYTVNNEHIDNIQYIITSPPYQSEDVISDAGTMVGLKFNSHHQLEDEVIDTFNQSMINQAMVAYRIPHCVTYGKCRMMKIVKFKFSVTCPKCAMLYDEMFTLHLNRMQSSSPIFIKLGETRLLNHYLNDITNSLDDDDDDDDGSGGGDNDDDVISLSNNPEFGVLVRNGSVVKLDTNHTLDGFLSKKIWYQHSHQVCSKDSISFSTNYFSHRFDIVALSESRSFSVEDLPASLNSHTLLNFELFASKILFKTGGTFEVIEQPKHGYIYVDDEDDVRGTFTIEELKSQSVYFKPKHNNYDFQLQTDSFLILYNSEILPHSENRRGGCHLSLFNISLTFGKSKSDSLLIISNGTINVNLISRSIILSPHIIAASSNSTTSDNQLIFIIAQSPAWGRIVKSSSVGHMSPSERTIASFTNSDLKKNHVRYSLGNIYGRTNLGMLMDSFHVYLTDGKQNSSIAQILVNISMPTYAENIVKRRNHRNVNRNNVKRTSKKIEDENIRIDNEHFFHSSSNSQKDRKKNNLHLKVNNIRVSRRGQAPFTIYYERSSQKRRSMTESTLSLDVPPSHGRVLLLRSQNQDIAESTLKSKEERFHNLSLTDISNEIRMIYKHDGSDSSYDNFILSLSNDNGSIKKAVFVKVGSKSKSVPVESIKKQDLIVIHQSPTTLNSSNLMVVADRTNPDEIEFEVVNQPTRGYLKVLDQQLESSETPLDVGSYFTQLDVDENRVFYVPVDTTAEKDNFTFKINDDPHIHTFNIFVKNHERSLLPLRIRSDQSSVCLNASSFNGLDKVDAACFIVSVKKQPHSGVLGRGGQTFSGIDLEMGNVCYSGREQFHDDEFELSIINECSNVTIASRKFTIEFGDSNSETPHLDVSVPLMVVHGDRISLTPSNLLASSDGVDPSRIYFVVVDPPRHGRLLMDGKPVKEFSQEDINSELISYESSRIDDSMMDYFLFFVSTDKTIARNSSDGKASFFSILIQPASKISCKLSVTSPHMNAVIINDRIVFQVNSTHLKASHSSFSSRELVYHIKSKAKHGHIELTSSGKQVRRRFTQKDVDDNKLIFVVKNDSIANNDSFTFKLVDPNKNTIDNQRFTFEWSTVEFPNTHVKICRNTDVLTIPVIRRGLLSETCSVLIKAKYLSDKDNLEHLKTIDAFITFRANATKTDWTLKLTNDGLKKSGLRIKLNLFNASNAVIGKDKIVVQIMDAKSCSSAKNTSLIQEPHFKMDNFYEDEDYEDGSDDDDYLESDLSYYSDKAANMDKGMRRDPQQQMPSISQPCNPSTKSLLYLDVSTSQLFRCNGRYWEKWGWTSNTSGHKFPEKKETLEEKSQKTCPLGWLLYGDNCFLSSKVKMTWTEAEEICRRDGGHLAFVLSIDHLTWLSGLTDGSKFWIGLNNRRDISQWEFTGSALFSSVDLSRDIFYNWGMHQPCGKCLRSRCAQVSEELHYHNKQCTKNRARFVCARPSRLLRSSRRAKHKRSKMGRQHHRTI